MRWSRLTFVAALVALLAMPVAVPAPARAAEVTFDTPSAQAELGTPITFSTSFSGADRPERVELLLTLPGERAVSIVAADVSGGNGSWQATAMLEGHSVPNTPFNYRFRARSADGETLGPPAQVVVTDPRFEWRTIEGPIVRLHWYEGDEAFAQRALDIGERAIADASELLGVTEAEPIDFFIYSSEPALRGALGPGTRENVGGQAHSHIRTMFGLIGPFEVNSDWVETLVVHELTHLVFDTATDNPYRAAPRWLNEGVAVYLSEGHTPGWRSTVEQAAQRGELIPLDGLGGLFPTTANEFRLAYAESVSAIDFFVSTYDEQTLWDLVRSYARGVSDDEAFIEATGADLGAFNAAWMASLGAEVPEPVGPQPGVPGPLPPEWEVEPVPTPGPDQPPAPIPTAAPTPAPGSGPGMPPDGGSANRLELALLGMLVGAVSVGLVVVLVMLVRRRSQPPPPSTPWR